MLLIYGEKNQIVWFFSKKRKKKFVSSFYDFDIWFWNCFDGVEFSVFHLISQYTAKIVQTCPH